MEKTKLVRTFGTALATATLSFGLFVPTALAVDATVGTATVEIKGEAKAGNEAKANDTVEIEIPVSVSDVDAIKSGVMTFKVSNGGVGQELTLDLHMKDNNTLAFDKNDAYKNYDGQFVFVGETDNNGQMKITKIYAKVTIDAEFMNGTWKLDSIKLYNSDVLQNDDTEIADIKADATFKVSGNSHKQSFALDLETLMTKKTVYRGKENSLVASLKPANDGNDVYLRKAEVVYVNPAGEEQKYTVSPINGVQFTVNSLNTQVDGIYELKSIKLYDGAGSQVQSLVDTVVYEDLGILDDGDYEVTLTGVEAMIRLYNPWTGEHIYTSDPLEAVAAEAAGWKNEGLAWYAPVTEYNNAAVSPVYRVYNQYNGEHHYTTSLKEAVALVAAGWTDEGIGFYTTTANDALAQPVFRLFNPFATVGTHHYTLGEDERDAMVKAGWKNEGVGWYGVKVPEYK